MYMTRTNKPLFAYLDIAPLVILVPSLLINGECFQVPKGGSVLSDITKTGFIFIFLFATANPIFFALKSNTV